MSIGMLEEACEALGALTDQVVFLGGATLVLWVTDPGAPPPRPTKDVDVAVEATTRAGMSAFDARLREAGFEEDQDSGVICRWRHRTSELVLDVIPADPRILGFDGTWIAQALPHAIRVDLPSGAQIRAVAPAYLVATKLEAFRSRGGGDYVGSRDLGDVIALIDGREELVQDVRTGPDDLRRYVAATLKELMADTRFVDGVFASLRPDIASQARGESVVLPRIEEIVSAVPSIS